MWSALKNDVLDRSMDGDKYQEGIGQRKAMKYLRKAMKYLRKSCYHRIECTAANSLATLNEEVISEQ